MPHKRKDSPFWWISFTDASGERVRESSGTADRREAKALEAKRRLDAHQQKVWGAEPARYFDDLMLRYLTETEGKKSHDRDLSSAKRLYPHFSGKIIQEIAADDVSNYKQARRKDGVKDGTIIKELREYVLE